MFKDITLLFCFVDDFCKECEKQMRNYLIENNEKMRKLTRVSGLEMSEIITIILLFYRSNMLNFKTFYKYLELHHKKDFPKMPTYERFCAIKQKATPMLPGLFKCILSKGQSEGYIDATALRVSHNKRTNSHKVFKGIAAVGKSTMGWFYGFKLHLVIDLQGNIINAKLTATIVRLLRIYFKNFKELYTKIRDIFLKICSAVCGKRCKIGYGS